METPPYLVPHSQEEIRILHEDADLLLVTDIYAAGEEKIPGIDAEGLAEAAFSDLSEDDRIDLRNGLCGSGSSGRQFTCSCGGGLAAKQV